MDHPPGITVIIPTHRRSTLLKRTLDALGVQDYPREQMEVLVVADGWGDPAVPMLRQYRAPFLLRTLEQPCLGPAAARNHAAALARGRLLIFIDDDIEITPSFVKAHALAHPGARGAVIGYLFPVFQGRLGFFQVELRIWWQAMFQRLRRKGHRYTYDDFLSGNFSIERELFEKVGRFDPDFRCHEDYEFGWRLIKSGSAFHFEPQALAYHHVTTTLEESLERKYQEGRADVLLGLRHPELRAVLPMARWMAARSHPRCLLCRLAFAGPAAGDILMARMRHMLPGLERVHLRRYWRAVVEGMMGYRYWRGVARELTSRQALAEFLRGGLQGHPAKGKKIEIDLKEGLAKAEHRLDGEQPESVDLRYGRERVGWIPPRPGAEPLRGLHLRPILAHEMHGPFLKALALEGALGFAPDRLGKAPFMKAGGEPVGGEW